MESWDPGRGPDSFVGTRESWRTLERGLWYFRKADLWSFSVREAAKQYPGWFPSAGRGLGSYHRVWVQSSG